MVAEKHFQLEQREEGYGRWVCWNGEDCHGPGPVLETEEKIEAWRAHSSSLESRELVGNEAVRRLKEKLHSSWSNGVFTAWFGNVSSSHKQRRS
ncbi:hypothetical protein VIGAN_05190100 [Vigna angularis var. angularis]|uniref:Uncharacterized protein n=1 Tax=Vigna angularis var. angularis TaxID=157739 RepID=A0A0S3S6G8_PHAAN|nr:hypothetical protein VIGAN_05190100 [Vigna angularis var. angularis]